MTDLEQTINAAWDDRDNVNFNTQGEIREAVMDALDMLDSGKTRVAEQRGVGDWQVNQWLKKAVLLSFRLQDMVVIPGAVISPVLVNPHGGIKCHQSFQDGMKRGSVMLASVLFQAVLSVNQPMLPPAL